MADTPSKTRALRKQVKRQAEELRKTNEKINKEQDERIAVLEEKLDRLIDAVEKHINEKHK